MDPEVLMVMAMLDGLPQPQDAWIKGFEMMMWHNITPRPSAQRRAASTAKHGKLQP